MTTTPAAIADFLQQQHLTHGYTARDALDHYPDRTAPWDNTGDRTAGRPATAEQLGEELLHSAAFAALRLGTFLGTPDGRLIAEGVSLVIPPIYKFEYDLTVKALTHAAQRQQHDQRRQAVPVLATVLAPLALLALTRTIARAAT